PPSTTSQTRRVASFHAPPKRPSSQGYRTSIILQGDRVVTDRLKRSRRRPDFARHPELTGEVSASRFHNGRWPPDPDVDPTPLAPVGGFGGEHVLLAQAVNESRCRHHGPNERPSAHELAASPLRDVP